MRIEWKGEKLTEKRALFLCWKLWEWLAENPDKCKSQWPEWKYNQGHVEEMNSDCPCCEFAGRDKEGKRQCHKCLLWTYWGSGKVKYACERQSSPFNKWSKIIGKNAIKYARRIAAAAKRRYEKL